MPNYFVDGPKVWNQFLATPFDIFSFSEHLFTMFKIDVVNRLSSALPSAVCSVWWCSSSRLVVHTLISLINEGSCLVFFKFLPPSSQNFLVYWFLRFFHPLSSFCVIILEIHPLILVYYLLVQKLLVPPPRLFQPSHLLE